MARHPYYNSSQWKRLRREALMRDGYTCTVRGCRDKASTVDHIVSRKHGGIDALSNLRSLCSLHDNQVKEFKGKRRNESFIVKQVRLNGMPLDPNHPWNTR